MYRSVPPHPLPRSQKKRRCLLEELGRHSPYNSPGSSVISRIEEDEVGAMALVLWGRSTITTSPVCHTLNLIDYAATA